MPVFDKQKDGRSKDKGKRKQKEINLATGKIAEGFKKAQHDSQTILKGQDMLSCLLGMSCCKPRGMATGMQSLKTFHQREKKTKRYYD